MDTVFRVKKASEDVDTSSGSQPLLTTETATYIYVDSAITVTAEGGTNTSNGKDTDLKSLSITLEKGWNVLYSKEVSLGWVASNTTFELKAGNTSTVYWYKE